MEISRGLVNGARGVVTGFEKEASGLYPHMYNGFLIIYCVALNAFFFVSTTLQLLIN